jgi:hypothetical protein
MVLLILNREQRQNQGNPGRAEQECATLVGLATNLRD